MLQSALFIRGKGVTTVGMHKKFWVIAWKQAATTMEKQVAEESEHDEGASKVDDLTKVQLSLTNCPARGN